MKSYVPAARRGQAAGGEHDRPPRVRTSTSPEGGVDELLPFAA
jgi:hypothetical protein